MIRLLKKTSRNYLISGIIAMTISLFALSFLTHYFIQEETDEGLYSTTYRIEKLLEKNPNLNSIDPIIDVITTEYLKGQVLKDTLIYDPAQNEIELFRELSTYKKINGQKYMISVRTLVVESKDILLSIFIFYLAIIFLIFLVQYYFNKINAKIIWQPFFENLESIKKFSLQSNRIIKFQKTNILEFSELNTEIVSLTNKVVLDYQNLKQFTQDVSHEIQTPLAIIQAKVTNIIDGNGITDEQYKLLSEIQQNIQRLARLNRNLVLLAKIENQQFISSKKIDITLYIEQSVNNFEELSGTKISIEKINPIEVFLDEHLSQILVDNLISNAIKYTPENGEINVSTNNQSIIVSNTGKQAINQPDKLYNRFYREGTTKKSLGLGLAIVKKICEENNIEISYSFENQMHLFKLHFPV